MITVAGALLVAAALREVFHTLLHPSGAGQLTPAIFRGMWRAVSPAGARGAALAGPLAVVSTILAWTFMVIVGWALVIWPHMPDGFQVSTGLPASAQDDLLDAIYVSATALSTLGFGDIVAVQAPLRIALVVEALVGFGLLTASISWVLSIYPALTRGRTLAARINALVSGDGDEARLVRGYPDEVLALVLHDVSDRLDTTRVDFVQHPFSYFFAAPSPDLSLPPAIRRLQRAIARHDLPPQARTAASAVSGSLHALGDTLGRGSFGLRGEDAQAVLRAYAADRP